MYNNLLHPPRPSKDVCLHCRSPFPWCFQALREEIRSACAQARGPLRHQWRQDGHFLAALLREVWRQHGLAANGHQALRAAW